MQSSDSHHDLVRRIRNHVEARLGAFTPGIPGDGKPSKPCLSGPIPLAEILEAEAALGFSLPPLLREIYLQVGYGSLGLGGSLLPLKDKQVCGEYNGRPVVMDEGIVSLHQYLRRETYIPPELEDLMPVWPEQLVPFLDWGCADRSCVDCSKPEAPVYWLPARFEAEYLPPLQSPSLAAWLEAALEKVAR